MRLGLSFGRRCVVITRLLRVLLPARRAEGGQQTAGGLLDSESSESDLLQFEALSPLLACAAHKVTGIAIAATTILKAV